MYVPNSIQLQKTKGPQMSLEDKVYKTKEQLIVYIFSFAYVCRLMTNFW